MRSLARHLEQAGVLNTLLACAHLLPSPVHTVPLQGCWRAAAAGGLRQHFLCNNITFTLGSGQYYLRPQVRKCVDPPLAGSDSQ